MDFKAFEVIFAWWSFDNFSGKCFAASIEFLLTHLAAPQWSDVFTSKASATDYTYIRCIFALLLKHVIDHIIDIFPWDAAIWRIRFCQWPMRTRTWTGWLRSESLWLTTSLSSLPAVIKHRLSLAGTIVSIYMHIVDIVCLTTGFVIVRVSVHNCVDDWAGAVESVFVLNPTCGLVVWSDKVVRRVNLVAWREIVAVVVVELVVRFWTVRGRSLVRTILTEWFLDNSCVDDSWFCVSSSWRRLRNQNTRWLLLMIAVYERRWNWAFSAILN